MADNLTIARPYARAAFSVACDQNKLSEWQMALEMFAVVVRELQTRQIIGDPHISDEELLSICFDLIQHVLGAEANFSADLKRFVELVLFEGRLNVVPDIAWLYHKLLIERQRVIEAQVISAGPLGDGERQQLNAALEKRFGSKVSAHYSEDPSLIGGLIVKSDDWVFDGTVRSKLNRLAERII